ncbi:MAG TPA: hypothetical protein VLJ16_14360 [Acidobacteriota bacterium]|nr:hypothetical protein [Acidobacteriota bacterium]
MRKTATLGLLVLLPLLCAAYACRNDSAPPAGPSKAAVLPPEPGRVRPAVDQALDDRFAFMSGLPCGTPSFAALESEAAWKDFSAEAATHGKAFDDAIIGPMRTWAKTELRSPRKQTRTLFYPFGGPDLATALALFPDVPTVVLIGLEPVGNLPEFERLSAERRAEAFADLGPLVLDFLKRGYFVTMEMMDAYSKGHIDGALPVIGFFLKRAGFSIVSVRRLLPAAGGGWDETPYRTLEARPRRPYGIRIDCVGAGETMLRSVYYFSCDIENRSFPAGSPLYDLFDGLPGMTTFVKAGSYLLHWDNFSNLRQLILDRSLYVLQDDTAVPYRFFKAGGWTVTLYGRYATPVKDFKNVEQPDLRAAYEDPEMDVRPLPYHFGYRWRTQVDNLLLAERPRRPFKVPIVK